MKTMSIAQYAAALDQAKTPAARARLFVRSLGLRFKLWNTWRAMGRDRRRQYRRQRAALKQGVTHN